MFFRTLFHSWRSRRGAKTHIHDVVHTRFRVLPTDLDVLGHMNNGVYFSIMDIARFDLLIRSGAWAKLSRLKYYPIVTNETITFRKSLQPWQRFTIETRVVGYDPRSVYIEQRFVVAGEVFARGFIRGRFLKRSGGSVSMTELADALDVDLASVATPEWLERWSADVALPPTKAHAPSEWA
jgi:acyl-CoA thioesterase FadM